MVTYFHPLDFTPLSARIKIERADQHISDLNKLVQDFGESDFYSLRVENNLWSHSLRIDIDQAKFPQNLASQILGDAIHNLRSALDILFRQAILTIPGELTGHTKFPIVGSAQKLKEVMNGGLEQQAGPIISDLIKNSIKPYPTGNDPLWALHELDIMDKHQFVIPALKLMAFYAVRLQDDKGVEVVRDAVPVVYSESDCTVPLDLTSGNYTVKDKGHASVVILFPVGTPFEGQPIIPEIHNLREVVSGVFESFELALNRSF
jgi:hypothetical protein